MEKFFKAKRVIKYEVETEDRSLYIGIGLPSLFIPIINS